VHEKDVVSSRPPDVRTRLNQAQLDSRLAPAPGATGALQKTIDDLNLYFYRSWRVEDLAEIADMSVPNFFRCFRRVTGSTPINFLRRVRINQAKRRLIESTDSIKEVAEQVGYSDQFYFSRDFKHHTGMSPSDFRKHEIGKAPNKK
jgi:AraC-like DNA-binding protein